MAPPGLTVPLLQAITRSLAARLARPRPLLPRVGFSLFRRIARTQLIVCADGTIRQAGNGIGKEPSDEYDEDYEDEDLPPPPPPVEDELPDTTMLDSVVLPAIASVSRLDSGP